MERTTTTKAEVGRLAGQGKTVLEISYALKVSPQMVYRHLKALNLTPGQGGEG